MKTSCGDDHSHLAPGARAHAERAIFFAAGKLLRSLAALDRGPAKQVGCSAFFGGVAAVRGELK